MSLIDELEIMASTPGVSACDLLRKAKIVAVKLKQTDTSKWVDSELSGEFDEYPDYRRVPVKLMQRNAIYGPQPVHFSDARINAIVNEPRPLPLALKQIEELAASSDDALFINLPPSLIPQLMKWGVDTPEIYHMTPRTAVAGIVDAVRTRVLDWALALDQHGIRGEGMSFTSQEQKEAKNISIHFNGNTNFAGVIGESHGVGASGINQHLEIFAKARELSKKLRESVDAVPREDSALLSEVASGIDEATANNDVSGLRRALKWAKAALPKIGMFVAKAAVESEISHMLDSLPL